jgi:hypothetical protein
MLDPDRVLTQLLVQEPPLGHLPHCHLLLLVLPVPHLLLLLLV